ncbi:MAG: GNAT family N-acetyltransferase [Treponema sp.]|nr:GNAT family N-acetyltransferase [Treponema sp.]
MIETERLILRNYTMEDFDALHEIVSDAETMQHYPSPFDEEKTRGWIKWNLENYEKYGFGLWAVVLKETGELIGDCGITIQDIDGELLPEIGYHIHKKYWRRGFAKEAARAVRDWVFTNTEYNEIYSYMKYTNVGSYSTAIANGMRKVKEYLDPKNYISCAYSIKRSDWENIKAGPKTVTKEELKNALVELGVTPGMSLEVHSSLKSFGRVEGGAQTVIDALKETVTDEGSIFMPALRLSPEMEPTEEDKKLGIKVKIKVLDRSEKKTAMGVIADTFRSLPDTFTGTDVISTSGWGKHGKEVLAGGLDYAIHNGGKALLFGVDIYKLTAMHYMEVHTPREINEKYAPSEEVNKIYPPDQWFIETGHPPLKAWYTIQDMAYKRGLIKETYIGNCRVMFFDILSVVSLYAEELKNRPFELWGMK